MTRAAFDHLGLDSARMSYALLARGGSLIAYGSCTRRTCGERSFRHATRRFHRECIMAGRGSGNPSGGLRHALACAEGIRIQNTPPAAA
jgi:hypothetical protein